MNSSHRWVSYDMPLAREVPLVREVPYAFPKTKYTSTNSVT